MRKLALLGAAVALMTGTLTACLGGPPPPPPTDPHDVLVVGDSVSFSFGCVLGDAIPGFDPAGCPARPGYTTHNEATGGCTMVQGSVILYNGGTATAPNCDTVADAQGRTWAEAADHFTPKVVVINTAGFEIVDRRIGFVAVPDYQWGGSTSSQEYNTAAQYYSNELYNAINTFRARGAAVLVANAPYADPPQPVPPPNEVPAGLQCTWWEPDDATAPVSAGPDCNGDGQAGSGGDWRSPTGNTSYRSSHTKYNQLNDIITLVKNQYFGGDNQVRIFNFKKHFNGPGDNQFRDWICPPPYDSTVVAQNQLDLNNPPNFAWKCQLGAVPSASDPYAIFARDVDHSHLSSAGEFDILQPYLESCVKSQLGIGGNAADCS